LKILVSGAAGYIGSTLCNDLLSKGHEVIAVDNLLYGGRSLIPFLNHPSFFFIPSDINDTENYCKYVDKSTTIVHLAAIVGDPASKKFPKETNQTNIDGTSKLIELAMKNKVTKLIFASTCSNYGQVKNNDMANEEYNLRPLSLYAETKVKIEEYLKNQIGSVLDWTILRFSTAYGLSLRPRFDLTVNDFTLHALKDRKLEIFNPNSNRPYVHVKDVARAIELCLEKKEQTSNEIFNVGDNSQNYKKIDIVEEVKRTIGPFGVELVEKGFDPRDYRVDFSKIHNVLGYDITMKVPDGISEIVEAIKIGLIKDTSSLEFYNA